MGYSKTAFLWLLVPCFTACGSQALDSATLTGKLDGQPLKVASALFAAENNGTPLAYGAAGMVVLSDSAAECDALGNAARVGGSRTVTLLLGAAGKVATGSYSLSTTEQALWGSAQYIALDAQCNNAAGGAADRGTIDVEKISSSSLLGTLDLTFSNGDTLTGTFNAKSCPAVGEHADATLTKCQ